MANTSIKNAFERMWQHIVAKFAPAGYGLGEDTARQADDLNTATKSGYYLFKGNTPNNPFGVNGFMHVKAHDNWSFVQEAVCFDYPKLPAYRIRGVLGDNYNEWEWVNPPMVLGVEYRTTERYNGMPVYVMAFNGGALPASGAARYLTVAGNINIIDLQLVAVQGTNRFQFPLVWGDDGTVAARVFKQFSGTESYISVQAFKNLSDYTIEGVVKYTK